MDALGEVRTESATARRRQAEEWGVPVERVKIKYVSGSIGTFVWDFELLPEDDHCHGCGGEGCLACDDTGVQP